MTCPICQQRVLWAMTRLEPVVTSTMTSARIITTYRHLDGTEHRALGEPKSA